MLPTDAQEKGFKDGDALCLRKCVVAIECINSFRSNEGRGQSNFVRSILDAYGSDDDQPRLPLNTVLTCGSGGPCWVPAA